MQAHSRCGDQDHTRARAHFCARDNTYIYTRVCMHKGLLANGHKCRPRVIHITCQLGVAYVVELNSTVQLLDSRSCIRYACVHIMPGNHQNEANSNDDAHRSSYLDDTQGNGCVVVCSRCSLYVMAKSIKTSMFLEYDRNRQKLIER